MRKWWRFLRRPFEGEAVASRESAESQTVTFVAFQIEQDVKRVPLRAGRVSIEHPPGLVTGSTSGLELPGHEPAATPVGDEADEAYQWLRKEIENRFHNEASLRGIREQVKHHMSVAPGAIKVDTYGLMEADRRASAVPQDLPQDAWWWD